MRHLPHEVSDVQPVLDLLSIQDPTDIKVRLAVHLKGRVYDRPVRPEESTQMHSYTKLTMKVKNLNAQ